MREERCDEREREREAAEATATGFYNFTRSSILKTMEKRSENLHCTDV